MFYILGGLAYTVYTNVSLAPLEFPRWTHKGANNGKAERDHVFLPASTPKRKRSLNASCIKEYLGSWHGLQRRSFKLGKVGVES